VAKDLPESVIGLNPSEETALRPGLSPTGMRKPSSSWIPACLYERGIEAMERPTVQQIINVMSRKAYRVYDTPTIDWNLNIVGIRSQNPEPIKFDDLLVVFHRFLGNWDITYYPITTDPSLEYLRNPMNAKGTAILKEGQYRATYAIDIHNRGRTGAHKALCQRLDNVTVHRDSDRDGRLDIMPATEDTGSFGINIHKGPRGGQWDPDNTIYSAGCQVFADDRHFAEFMQKCEFARQAFGNSFTYTLLHEREFSSYFPRLT
jgi:hypothetical protein